MTRDLLISHPLPSNLIIAPTRRSLSDGLALSSRNAYLTPSEREYAGTLYAALQIARQAWEDEDSSRDNALEQARQFVQQRVVSAEAKGVKLRLDYVSLTDPDTFEPVSWARKDDPDRTAILSGALFVGETRLIDNLLCGDASIIES